MKKKLKRQNNPKFNEFIVEVNVECVSCNNLLQDFKFMKNVFQINLFFQLFFIYIYIYIYIYMFVGVTLLYMRIVQ